MGKESTSFVSMRTGVQSHTHVKDRGKAEPSMASLACMSHSRPVRDPGFKNNTWLTLRNGTQRWL